MDPNRLYVISSLHYHQDPAVNTRLGIEEVHDVRLQVIKALGFTLGGGSYFSDGVHDEIAADFNSVIADKTLDQIVEVSEELLEDEEYMLYDSIRTSEVFKQLAMAGMTFNYKPTEGWDPQNVYDALTPQIAEEYFDNPPSEESMEDFAYRRQLEIRDEAIVENVVKHGTAENILYVGNGHQLATLPHAGLEAYRVDITRTDEGIQIKGELPERFKEAMSKIPSTTVADTDIKLDVTFV